ncbi:hypothetical protein [Kribbella sp. NPDC048915]|uniref:hypothetical protein n=1 Tax=Kribbella sp. NPDC048915 TaxID=3155148 RepID=UPI0033E40DA7
MPPSVPYEFPDQILPMCHGLPGSLSPGSPAADPADGTVVIGPAHSLRYRLDTPLADVVGISCRVRIRHLVPPVTSSLQILRLGDAFGLGLEPLTAWRALVRVRLQRVSHDLGQVPNLGARFMDLQFDWHIKGKTYLRVDGRLVGYHDTFARGSRLTIEDITFGPDVGLPGALPAGLPGALPVQPATLRQDPAGTLVADRAQSYQLDRFSVGVVLGRPHRPRRHLSVVHRP